MEVLQFQPQTQVIARTWTGQEYDLTGDLFSWSRTKSMTNGTFTIYLVPRTDSKGRTWSERLPAMTYIEIRASKNGNKVNGQLPVVLRGFVDSEQDNTQMPQQGGPAEPRVAITGQDYTKILTAWQILYLFTQNTFQKDGNLPQIVANEAGFGLFANFKIPMFSKSINAYMESLFSNILQPTLKGLAAHNYQHLPLLTHLFDFPNYPINGLAVASYTGSYFNLFQYVASPPFGELFVRDEASGPILHGRMTPYKTITGVVPKPGKSIGSSGTINGITNINVQQSDQDLYTYFLTWAADAQIVGPVSMPTFMPGLSNGVMTKKASLYGITPLEIDTPWVSLASSNSNSDPNGPMKLAATLNEWLMATLGDNELFWSGTITCHGDETIQIGTYRTVPSQNREYYISQISDTFNYAGNTWTANVSVVRGWDLK